MLKKWNRLPDTAAPEERFRLAQLHLADDAQEKSKPLLEALLADDPDNPAYLALYIQSLLLFDDKPEARRRNALERKPR